MLFGYNKALAEAGLEEAPKTWEEALEYAKKLNNPILRLQATLLWQRNGQNSSPEYYVWQAGGDLTKENEDGTAELTFTDPAVIEAAKSTEQLKSEGVLQSDMTLKFGDLTADFAMGKISV